jgi:alpha-D-ribose 1-methylphosphonate 5-triphosphate synthase subunit PhnH
MLSLLDRETSFLVAANNQWLPPTDPIAQWIALRSGSNGAPPDQASFALFCDKSGGGLATQLSPGTLLEPELSATAIYCIDQLASTSEELSSYEEILMLKLQGPGIEKIHTVNIAGLSDAQLNDIIVTRRGYPLGIDVYLVDIAGRCIGLPRTTRIGVVNQE